MLDAFARQYGDLSKEELGKLVEEKMGVVRARMEEREEAVRRNREIEGELETLKLQRDAEVRVLEKMKGGGGKR